MVSEEYGSNYKDAKNKAAIAAMVKLALKSEESMIILNEILNTLESSNPKLTRN